MNRYPASKKNTDERATQKTEEDKNIARQFGKEFFDGERKHGYGGYNYHPRFWTDVVRDMANYYHLTQNSKILDVGCGKGFMLYDFTRVIPGISVRGIDISEYAIANGKEEIKPFLSVGDAKNLEKFANKEFDLAISITTAHNLPLKECKNAIKEIQRVGKNAFLTVDAWRNEEEKEKMLKWNLTAKTLMGCEDWEKLFQEVGYTGDYYWLIP